ncbi:MAG: hypothetical protein IPO17_17365 [Flavobacteriales bacterium]|nr:hypothetical protein [Flavobacteriales bacterium]
MKIIHSNPAFVAPSIGAHYDPTWLVRLARKQHPTVPGYAQALARCVRVLSVEDNYIRFEKYLPVIFHRPTGQPGFVLEDPQRGLTVVDLRRDGKVSGVEVTGVHVTVAQMLALRKKFLEETGQA